MAEHSVFGATAPVVLTTFSDADPDSWLSTQFYIPIASTLSGTLTGMRLYVPAGSGFIGLSGFVAFMRRAAADGGVWTGSGNITLEFDSNGTRTSIGPLVQGWNVFHFAITVPMEPGDGILVGYRIAGGNWYLYDVPEAMPSSPIFDVGGLGFVMGAAQVGGGATEARSNYRGSWTAARWYGHDILLDIAGGAFPTGGFEGAYSWGPAISGGTIDAKGGFASIGYGWGPATASGVTGTEGVFEGGYAFGPALFTSRTTVRGGFQGAFAFGAAEFVGTVDTEGGFSGVYIFGRAVFGGTGGEIPRFPVCDFDLVGTGPTLGLRGEGPTLGLEGSCSS